MARLDNGETGSGLLTAAYHALARILEPDSELRELWEESDDFASWESSVQALRTALAGADRSRSRAPLRFPERSTGECPAPGSWP